MRYPVIPLLMILATYKTEGSPTGVRKAYPINPLLKSTSGVYFRDIQDVVPYETTGKIVIALKLPSFEVFTSMDNSKPTYQMIHNTSVELKRDFQDYLRTFDGSKQRPKRQVFVAGIAGGILLTSIYAKISQKFTGTEDEAQRHLQDMEANLRSNKQDFLFLRNNFDEFARETTVTVQKLYQAVSDEQQLHLSQLHLTQLQIGIAKVREGLERCSNHKVPVQLLSESYLNVLLLQLENTVRLKGYVLAIPRQDLVRFQKQKVADCFVTGKTLYILMNVPLQKTEWHIKQMIPVPFSLSNQTCSLTASTPEVVAVSRDAVRVIDHYMMRFCDFLHDHLCLVPEFSRPSGQTASCSESLYNGKGIQHLSPQCKFECTNSTELSIIQVEKAKIIVANAHKISVQCPSNYHDFKVKEIGSIEVTIKCICNYTIESIILDSTGVCLSEVFKDDDIVHVVPNFLNFSLNDDPRNVTWPAIIPILNYGKRFDTKEENEAISHVHNIQHHSYWLIVLSVLTFILIVTVGAAYCYFKNLK